MTNEELEKLAQEAVKGQLRFLSFECKEKLIESITEALRTVQERTLAQMIVWPSEEAFDSWWKEHLHNENEIDGALSAYEWLKSQTKAVLREALSDENIFFISSNWAKNNQDLRHESPSSSFKAGFRAAEARLLAGKGE